LVTKVTGYGRAEARVIVPDGGGKWLESPIENNKIDSNSIFLCKSL
jgi:hypothetical protein